jgi:hypothetical protein
MATKKSPGSALIPWEKQFAADAKKAVEQESTSGGGGQSVKFGAGGTITVAGATLPGNRLECVILGACFENGWYDTPYNPDDPQPPTCYAFGEAEKEMAPHPDCQQAQSDTCAGCPKNEFGSALVGRGKLCGNKKRIALVTANDAQDLDVLATVELATAKLSPTQLKAWAGYVRSLAELDKPRSSWNVVTEITGFPDQKNQYRLEFRMVETIDDSATLQVLSKRKDKVQEFLQQPYGPPIVRDKKPVKRGAVGGGKKFAAKGRR